MKTKQFKYSFFMILILSVLMISFNGCSKDDDDPVNSMTYLELHVGTKWALDDDGGVPAEALVPSYFRFVNNETKVLEGWYETPSEPNCYSYNDGINIQNGVLQITENSEQKLILKITYGSNESETFTCTIQGDILKIVYVYEEVGSSNEEYTMLFDKTKVNVDGLTLCQ